MREMLTCNGRSRGNNSHCGGVDNSSGNSKFKLAEVPWIETWRNSPMGVLVAVTVVRQAVSVVVYHGITSVLVADSLVNIRI